MRKPDIYVIPRNRGWAARHAGNDKVSSAHDTQRDAINQARNIALINKGLSPDWVEAG